MNCYDYDNQPDPGDMPMQEPDPHEGAWDHLDPSDTFDAEIQDHEHRGVAALLFGKQKRTAEPEPNDHGEPDWSTYI